jgi:hypothetical protein
MVEDIVRTFIGLFVFVAIIATAIVVQTVEPITVSVRPAVSSVRGTAQLKVLVERNDSNRTLTWEIDGPGYYRSSTMPLEGASAPRSWFFYLRNLPPGEFDVRATVKRTNNSESVALSKITVLGVMQVDR